MTRRQFVEDTAGRRARLRRVHDLGRVGRCEAQPRRREVVVNGKRVKTVDIHAHCQVPEAMALMGLKVTGQPNLPDVLLMSNAADRLRAMDEQGIDVEALSINPFWYKADRDVAQKLIAIQNEKLAEACAANPERFVAFASRGAPASRTSPPSSSSRASRSTACAARPSAAASTARSWPTRSSTRSGPRRKRWACWSSSTRRATAELERAEPLQGQRRARQRHRQPARDDDRALAPDLRGHARPVPRAQDLRGARRRLPAVVRGALRPGLPDLPGPLHPDAQEEADGVPAPALLRQHHLHARGHAAPDRRDRSGRRSSWAPTFRTRGRRPPWTSSSPRPACPTPTASPSSAGPRRSSSESNLRPPHPTLSPEAGARGSEEPSPSLRERAG